MQQRVGLNFKEQVQNGKLFSPPDDSLRLEAFVPSAGHHNHAANLAELPNGDLLCAWFAGSAEGAGDVNIALSRLARGADRWSQPVWVSDDPTRSEQNPVLFPAPDGRLWLLYTAQETRGTTAEEWARRQAAGEAEGTFAMQWTAIIRRRISTDNGWTWGPVETFLGKPTSFCRQRLVVLSNGDWLLPMYYSLHGQTVHGDDYSVVQISTDRGQSWTECPLPQSRGRVHACVIEVGPGDLRAFFRSRSADRIYVSRSVDYGRVWSPPVPGALPNNNASIQAIRLENGHIALAFNHFSANDDPTATVWPRRRYPLTVAVSDDGGETWPIMRHVDPGDGFAGADSAGLNRPCAYPSLLQTGDGALHLAYSYRGRQCIKHVRFTEDWVREQRDSVW